MYRAQGDDWLALAAEWEDAWDALHAIVDDPRLSEARFATDAARRSNEDELVGILASWWFWCARQDAGETKHNSTMPRFALPASCR